MVVEHRPHNFVYLIFSFLFVALKLLSNRLHDDTRVRNLPITYLVGKAGVNAQGVRVVAPVAKERDVGGDHPLHQIGEGLLAYCRPVVGDCVGYP